MNISELLKHSQNLHKTDFGIYSDFSQDTPPGKYEGREKLYDAIVGSRIYNIVLWGVHPKRYESFAQKAINQDSGTLLDAGSGTAVFTAKPYAKTRRSVILVDNSLGMLQAAGRRITEKNGNMMPEKLYFFQADIFHLPFKEGTFSTTLSMGMLHLFNDKKALIKNLMATLRKGGTLYLTSLVAERSIGRRYLNFLHRQGEMGTPLSYTETLSIIKKAAKDHDVQGWLRGSMGFFIIKIQG